MADRSTQDVRVRLVRQEVVDGRVVERPVELWVEALPAEGVGGNAPGGYSEGEVSGRVAQGMEQVFDAIGAVSEHVVGVMSAVRPDSLEVELGFEVKSESSGLVALLARAGGSATIKVTLSWSKPGTAPPAGAAGAVDLTP